MIFVVLSGIFVLIGTSETFNMLLFLLAITRAVIYFWPSNEKKIKTILIHIHKRVHYLYFAFITKTVIFFFVAMYMEWTDTNIWYILPAFVVSKQQVKKFAKIKCFQSIQVLLHVLIFVSAILHIPIMISIRKLSYLASAQQNNPQRYILWQIISVLMFKLVRSTIILYLEIWKFEYKRYAMTLVDSFTVHHIWDFRHWLCSWNYPIRLFFVTYNSSNIVLGM